MKVNYQLALEETIKQIVENKERPKLLIHSCCGPCSTYVLDYLKDYFEISIFYYNPNIYPEEEFYFRAKEQEDLCKKMGPDLGFIGTDHRADEYYKRIKGHEDEPEKGSRCEICFRLRLEETAKYGADHGFDYFTTSLSISPHKNSQLLNKIAGQVEEAYPIKYLYSDFKKREGFKKSVELTNKFHMYRQEYCGCEYSYKAYMEKMKINKPEEK